MITDIFTKYFEGHVPDHEGSRNTSFSDVTLVAGSQPYVCLNGICKKAEGVTTKQELHMLYKDFLHLSLWRIFRRDNLRLRVEIDEQPYNVDVIGGWQGIRRSQMMVTYVSKKTLDDGTVIYL